MAIPRASSNSITGLEDMGNRVESKRSFSHDERDAEESQLCRCLITQR